MIAAIELVISVGAVYGGTRLLLDAEAFGLEEAWLEGTPFPDYTVPGVVLGVVIGGGMLAAALLTLTGSLHARRAALWMGIVTLGFLAIETISIGYHGLEQAWLVLLIGLLAVALVGLGRRGGGRHLSR